MCFNNSTIYIIECIIWTIKCLILLMHGETMKISEFLIYFSISHFCSFVLTSLPDSLYQFCSAVVFHIVQVFVPYSLLALHYDSSVLSAPRARFEPATTLFVLRNNMFPSDCMTIRICEAVICMLWRANSEVNCL